MYLTHSPAQRAAVRADQLAHDSIRSLLNGTAPPALAPASRNSYGRWAASMEQLFAAYEQGGTPAVAQRYQELHRADPKLIALMGSGGHVDEPQIITLADLMAAELASPEALVENLIYVGLTNGSGRPKVGKSLLFLQIALAVSTGGKVLGFQAQQARVLYLALEDTIARLQDRLRKMGVQPNGHLDFALAWPSLREQGLQQIEAMLGKGYRLIIVDTYSRVNGSADQMDPNEMTQVFAALQQTALQHNAAIVVVDHHRKSARQAADNDPIDDIFGSTAKAGVLDCAMGLYRKHNSNDAVLKLVGRDFGDAEYALTWDPDHFIWQRKEDAKTPAKETRTTSIVDRRHVNEIMEALDALGQCSLARLAAMVKVDKSNLLDLLIAMVEAGLIRRNTDGGSITYAIAGQPVCQPTGEPNRQPNRQPNGQANAIVGAGTRSGGESLAAEVTVVAPDPMPLRSACGVAVVATADSMGTTRTTRTMDTTRTTDATRTMQLPLAGPRPHTRSSPPTRPKQPMPPRRKKR